jgi:FtsH ternary system domain X2
MCNPRRVMIHLNRCIEEAWQQTVEESQTVSEDVTELARITTHISLDQEMGDAALTMLERVLSGEFKEYEAWERTEQGQFRRDLGDLTLIYDPSSHQLSVEAQFTETVTAEARAAVEASGMTVGEVAVEAVGNYYDDGWGRRTKDVALAEAQQNAEHKLGAAIKELHATQHSSELAAAREEAQAKATALAKDELITRQEATRDALRTRLQVTLAQAQDRVAHVMNRAVGEAYRQTLIRMVLENGGRVLTDEQTGSVINMELELY